MKRSVLAAVVMLGLVACDKDEVVDSASVEVSWADKDSGQRSAFMASDVTPAMSPLFQAYDAEAYSGFGCGTCHGSDTTFAMPSAELPMLDAANMPNVDSGPAAKFMIEDVLPELKAQLEDDSLTCFSCHTQE